MSGKKPSSLRNALRDMRVNEPMRLSKSAPSFRPPSETTWDGKEAPRKEVPLSEVPQLESARSVGTQNEHSQNKETQKEEAQGKVAQNETPQIESSHGEISQSKPPRSEGAHAEKPQIKQPHFEAPQRSHAQNEATQPERPRNELSPPKAPQKKQAKNEASHIEVASSPVEAQNDLPQIEQPSRTFFRLSDRAFSYPQLQQLSGDCFRLFLWMSSKAWRYQNSDGTLRASVGFIEAHTGMSHATISRCLKTLREEQLIQLAETDYKRGNIWSVSPVAFAGCDPENLPPRSGGPQNEGPRNKAEARSKRDSSHLNLREKPPQIEGQIRKIKKDKKLSQEGAQKLFDRIEAIRAPEKQKTEREGLMKLLETHDPSEIEIALTYIERYGTLSGENCHSPFRYLTIVMDDVLKTCHQKRISISTNSQGAMPITQHQDERKKTEQRHLAVATFQSELTSQERAKLVEEYVAKECTSGFRPSEKLLTRLVAWHWYSDKMGIQDTGAF